MQHFEFGLFGLLIIEPPDAYTTNRRRPAAVPNSSRTGGYPRRTAANLAKFPQFPGFNSMRLICPTRPASRRTRTPITVPYDVEALWVLDDIDSEWHNVSRRATIAIYPAHMGTNPGSDDQVPGTGFFPHNYNPDYSSARASYVSRGRSGGSPEAPSSAPNCTVPPELNSGVTGMQISINAQRGQTILVRASARRTVPSRSPSRWTS